MKNNPSLSLLLLIIYFSVCTNLIKAETSKFSYLSMSLEELLNLRVDTGTLTGVKGNQTPFFLTTITDEDIFLTPARSMLDLIEVYVPGATFTNHWLGPRMGIRGVMGDQNNSYLMIVNGLQVNMRSFDGVNYEVQNRDMGDIERIEIISGPGSAIYGPGAIGGVINVVTKNAENSPGLNVTLTGDEYYRYGTISASYGYKNEMIEAFLYASISRSEGEEDTKYFYVDRAHGYGYGFMGSDWGNKGTGSPAPHMYEDFWNKPEYKLQLELVLFDEWTFQSRFTTFNYTALTQQSKALDGPEWGGIIGKMFSSSLENSQEFSDALLLKSRVSFQSKSNRRVQFYNRTNEVANHITQRHHSYSENEIYVNVILNYDHSYDTSIAVGAGYEYQYYGPEWGMKDQDFIMSFPAPIRFAVKSEDSGFHQQYGPAGFTSVIMEDIDASIFSFFGEINHKLNPQSTLLLSIRSDKHEFANWVTSPRVALIHEINRRNTLKFTAQRSVRLANFNDLYTENKLMKADAHPEKLKGFEFTYNRTQNEKLNLLTTVFFNSVDQIAWTANKDGVEKNGLVGTFDTMGLEAVVRYQDKHTTLGISYSLIDQLDWDPVEDIDAWIVGLNNERVDLEHYGKNRINNFPKHSAKLFYNHALTPELKIHADVQFAWQYQQSDMLNSFSDAHQTYGNAETMQEWSNIVRSLKDHGYSKSSITSNISISWEVPIRGVDLSMQLFVRNLLSTNHVRYVYQYWEASNNRQYSRQCGFIKEPRTFGVKASWSF